MKLKNFSVTGGNNLTGEVPIEVIKNLEQLEVFNISKYDCFAVKQHSNIDITLNHVCCHCKHISQQQPKTILLKIGSYAR